MNTTDMHIPSNKVRDIERYILGELDGLYPEGEIRMFIRMLFEAVLGWDQTALLLHRDSTVNQSDLLRFHWAVEDLKLYRPIQHIVGWTEFCGCRIEVDENTLIPRPETEEIVNWTINFISTINNQQSTPNVVDLCTGSGCIAIALAKWVPQARVTAVDISEKALNVARRNAEISEVAVDFRQSDVLSSQFTIQNSPFSLIISNPPYVMQQERSAISRNVLDWEPSIALFVPDADPLCFYRAIADFSTKHLDKEGVIVLEINERLGYETASVFNKYGFETKLYNDFRGKTRMLVASRDILKNNI